MAKKLSVKEAVAILDDCGGEKDCKRCLIGKPVVIMDHDAGLSVGGTVCSALQAVRDSLEDPQAYRP